MIDSMKSHPSVALLRRHGGCEESIVAEVDGVLCKVRSDKRLPGTTCIPTIIDAKKTQVGKIDDDDCQAAIEKYSWHKQMALYRTVAEKATGEAHAGIWVFIEDKPPHDVNVMYQEDTDFDFAMNGLCGVHDLLNRWKSAVESGEFPGVCNQIKPGGTREWFRKKHGWNPL